MIPEYRRHGVAADLMEHLIEDARTRGRRGPDPYLQGPADPLLREVRLPESGVSASVHGGAVWYDMLLEF